MVKTKRNYKVLYTLTTVATTFLEITLLGNV